MDITKLLRFLISFYLSFVFIEGYSNLGVNTQSASLSSTTSSSSSSSGKSEEHFKCGFRKYSPIINNNNNSTTDKNNGISNFGEFPWLIAIMAYDFNELILICSGNLIANSIILTTSECATFFKKQDLILRAGEYNITSTKDGPIRHQERHVQEIITQPSYDPENFNHNVAIIVTDAPFVLNDYISTICISTSSSSPSRVPFLYPGKKCIGTGWDNSGGIITTEENSSSDVPKKLDLNIVSIAECRDKLEKAVPFGGYTIDESMLCAGGEQKKDLCLGGSPLMCEIDENESNEKDRYYLAGLVSWGAPCGTPIPAVYANVTYSVEWIKGILTERKINESYYLA